MPRFHRTCGLLGAAMSALLLMAAGARAASIFNPEFVGEFTVTSAVELNGSTLIDRPDLIGLVNPISIRFTPTAGGFDVNFTAANLSVPGRVINPTLNGSDISWDFISTDNGVDLGSAHFAATLSLDVPRDTYNIAGTVAEHFLVSQIPPGASSFSFTAFSGTFSASQSPSGPTGIPLPAGVWAGLMGLAPLALLPRRQLVRKRG